MYKIYLKMRRKAVVYETGGVGVYVDDPNDWDGAYEKAVNGEWAEYLVTDREYHDVEDKFSPFDEEDEFLEDDDDDDYDNDGSAPD